MNWFSIYDPKLEARIEAASGTGCYVQHVQRQVANREAVRNHIEYLPEYHDVPPAGPSVPAELLAILLAHVSNPTGTGLITNPHDVPRTLAAAYAYLKGRGYACSRFPEAREVFCEFATSDGRQTIFVNPIPKRPTSVRDAAMFVYVETQVVEDRGNGVNHVREHYADIIWRHNGPPDRTDRQFEGSRLRDPWQPLGY
jgi:hypothetical protein